MVYTKKKYLEELKTNPYWEIEPHFWDWSMIKTFTYFKTISQHSLTVDEFKSAMYGEFDRLGKPILKGFIQRFNISIKIVKGITEKVIQGKKR